MIIECHKCEAKVDAKTIASQQCMDDEIGPYKITFAECPVCRSFMLGYQEYIQTGPDDYDLDNAHRLWPEDDKFINGNIPFIVHHSLDQAKRCYKAKLYDPCAVMCGRVLEGICSEYKIKKTSLKGGLKELLDRQIIDKRIYDWSEALREYRNIGAHVSKEKISKETARYILDFAEAICEYVFVLTEKFERFMKSKGKSKKEKK